MTISFFLFCRIPVAMDKDFDSVYKKQNKKRGSLFSYTQETFILMFKI